MREFREEGYQLTYPDEIGFAFNPCIIIQSGSGTVTSLDTTTSNA